MNKIIVQRKLVKRIGFGRSGRDSIIQRWVARDWNNARVGVGKNRTEAIRNMKPLGKAVEGSEFVSAFLAAYPYTPPLPEPH